MPGVRIGPYPKNVRRLMRRGQADFYWVAPDKALELGFSPRTVKLFTVDGSDHTRQMAEAVEQIRRLNDEAYAVIGGPDHSLAKAKAALAAERELLYAATQRKPRKRSHLPLVTVEDLREWLHYDPLTGLFTWLKRAGNIAAGTVAGSKHPITGYIVIGVRGRMYLAQRLAVLYMTGEWPENIVDHRNRIRDDNVWTNLRDVTQTANMANTGPSEYPPDPWRRSAIRARKKAKEELRGEAEPTA